MSEIVTDSDGLEYVPLVLPQSSDKSNQFNCPHCATTLQFRVNLTVRGVREVDGDGAFMTPSGQAQPVSLKSQRLMDFYRETGILGAFRDVVSEVKSAQLPHDIGGFLLVWLKTATLVSVPRLALRRLASEFGGVIEVYHAQGIAAIVSDGVVRSFAPIYLLRGELVRAAKGSRISVKTQANDAQMDTWIRTKHGYVVGTGAYFNEMKRKSAGSFDTSAL